MKLPGLEVDKQRKEEWRRSWVLVGSPKVPASSSLPSSRCPGWMTRVPGYGGCKNSHVNDGRLLRRNLCLLVALLSPERPKTYRQAHFWLCMLHAIPQVPFFGRLRVSNCSIKLRCCCNVHIILGANCCQRRRRICNTWRIYITHAVDYGSLDGWCLQSLQ